MTNKVSLQGQCKRQHMKGVSEITFASQADTVLASAVKAEQESNQELQKKKKKKDRKSKCQHLLDFPLLPTVQLGKASGDYHLNVSGSFTCYASSEYKSGALHTVIVGSDSPLNPGESNASTEQGILNTDGVQNFTSQPLVPVSKHSVPYRYVL